MNKLNIIIPHFNSPELLVKLLETIPADENIKAIVVDDGSTIDISVAKAYISERVNVEIYANDSGIKGAGASRNVGLKYCMGEWVLFADADDFFVEDWYGRVEKYLDSEYDLVFYTPYGIDLDTGEESKRHLYYKGLINEYLQKKSTKSLVRLKTGFCTPWSKLYKLDLIRSNDLEFSTTMVSNDIIFTTKYALLAQNLCVLEDEIYCVTRSGKTLTSKKKYENFWTRSEILLERYLCVKNNIEPENFGYAQMNKYILGRFVSCVLEGWGVKALIQHAKLYSHKDVKILTLDLFNPIEVYKVFAVQLAVWIEIKKKR